ncbi:DUF2000 domain-containing protein [Cohaesibacter sp. ES.047]|uniref:DUF2000 domain-containing protein n=1 Tax=Cohaesibacter sp. ES.047 TaxID=1798205 RepID=UPI000BB6D26B|nr:DUF2000 domain-containing protein [Cohaesibacter sp. ES.047]
MSKISEIRTAIIVNPQLPVGLMANTAGAIAIGLGARVQDLGARTLVDIEGREIDVSSRVPVPILQADGEAIRALMLKALERPDDRAVVPFPAFARTLHAYEDYEASLPQKDLSEEVIDGVGLAGPAKWVKSLTGSLKLLR